jgi:hypothetical protein
MTDRADGAEQAKALRDLARQARRLAMSVSNGDRQQLIEHAEQLEQQALDMEQGVSPSPPPTPVVQVQVQQQQQHETGPPADPPADLPVDPGAPKPKD